MSARPDAAAVPDPLAPAAAAPLPPGSAAPVSADAAPSSAAAQVADTADAAAPGEPLTSGAGRTAVVVLATIAFIYLLQWAQKFLVPVVFGVFLAYTLNPLVAWLERARIPRAIGTSLVVLLLFCAGLLAANSLFSQFESIVGQVPAATRRIAVALEHLEGTRHDTLDKMKEAANALEKATAPAGAPPAAKGKQPAPVVVAQPASRLTNWLLTGSMSAAAFLGQATMVVFLAFFLLISGETFKRKLVKITGPSLTKKKITVHILDDIDISIQRYMFMLLVTNGLLAILMWAGMTALGLNNAGAWALAAGLLHLVPYFGPLLTVAMLGMAAFLQFGTLASLLAVVAITLAVATLVGTFITTWMAGRIAKMNPAAVFIGLLFWGWLWGVPGLLLGIPIIVIVKVVTERVEGMNSIAELLGE